MLECDVPRHRDVPTPRGFSREGDTWRCEVETYAGFVASVTGLEPPERWDAEQCYRAGVHLEGFIEQRRAAHEWDESLLEDHPDVEALAEIEALSLFFRACHGDCAPDADFPFSDGTP